MSVTLNQLIRNRIYPHLEYLFQKVLREKDAVIIDGVSAFHSADYFVPGKVVNAFSYLIIDTAANDPDFEQKVAGFREIIDFTAHYPMKTWGIYYYLTALVRLQRHGLLDEVVRPDKLVILKRVLDWRTIVRADDLTLINLPTNYYGCALGVARLRMLLGWEAESSAQRLYDKVLAHIDEYSGEYGFADETDGEGRFDRYSVLLPAEICQRLIDTGMAVPERLQQLLRKSCDIHLMLANEAGHGFNYGRTIGAYGDTSTLEVLSIAAYLGVLTPEEQELAYAFCTRITAKFTEFWIDSEMKSVNMWEKGRKPDPYMGKHRILGENLSLSYQHIHTCDIWNRAGFADKVPMADFETALAKLPSHYLVRFAAGTYERALAIVRDGKQVICLPLVNGGASQYRYTPYYPIPHAVGMLAGSPHESNPQLLPRFTFSDGSQLMPLAYMKDIEARSDGPEYRVTYRQEQLCRLTSGGPEPDIRVQVATEYVFRPGVIIRNDCYTPTEALDLAELVMEFATFSTGPVVTGVNKVGFQNGAVEAITVSGFTECAVEAVNEADERYQTPHGVLRYRAIWRSGPQRFDQPLTIRWEMRHH